MTASFESSMTCQGFGQSLSHRCLHVSQAQKCIVNLPSSVVVEAARLGRNHCSELLQQVPFVVHLICALTSADGPCNKQL